MTKVSVIITAYNYESYVEECLTSCLKQRNVRNYEIIFVDDGSTDETLMIAKGFNDRKNLRIFSKNNSGIEASSNFGIRKARGEYVVRVDADDKLAENYLENLMKVVNEQNSSFYYSDYFVIDDKSQILTTSNLPQFDKDEIVSRGDFLATGTLYRKEDLYEVDLYNETSPNCGLENYELILKLLTKGYTGYKVDQPLFYYRRHQKNLSEKKRKNIIQYGGKLFKRFDLGVYQTNKFHPYNLKM